MTASPAGPRGNYVMGNSPAILGDDQNRLLVGAQGTSQQQPSSPRQMKNRGTREKVFSRQERYLMICEIFNHLTTDEDVKIKNIYE